MVLFAMAFFVVFILQILFTGTSGYYTSEGSKIFTYQRPLIYCIRKRKRFFLLSENKYNEGKVCASRKISFL